jgi:hypothetical protein
LPAHNLRKKEKEKKETKGKKKEVISSQITLNHDTRAIQRERGCQDESNDVAESRLQPLESTTRTARS